MINARSPARSSPRPSAQVYRTLGLSGYTRLDLRLTGEGEVWLIEANGNPDLVHDEDFAKSAPAAGVEYPALIQKILELGRAWKPAAEAPG